MGFWLFDWYRENEITSPDQIQVLLTDSRQFRALQMAAARVPDEPLRPLETSRGLVAGRGIDLTGIGACMKHRECIRAQVDTLLRRAWFYFDEIIVDDMTWQLATVSRKGLAVEAAAGWLESVLYLQTIGAENLVRFYMKQLSCNKCGKIHAKDFFHDAPHTYEEDLISILEREHTLAIYPNRISSSQVEVRLHGPQFPGSGFGGTRAVTWLRNKSEAAIKRELVESVLSDALANFYNDSLVSQRAQAPLGSATEIESFLLRYAASPNGDITSTVAFELSLPFIENVPVAELINVRIHESEAFEAFRSSLRVAIHERLKNVESPDPAFIAKQIEQDVVEPKLADLRHKLKRNAETLAQTAVGAGLGAFAGVVGLFVPGLQAIGAAGGLISVAATNAGIAQLRERGSLKANEMFYLLRATHGHDAGVR